MFWRVSWVLGGLGGERVKTGCDVVTYGVFIASPLSGYGGKHKKSPQGLGGLGLNTCGG
jgi:hypothetical protein